MSSYTVGWQWVSCLNKSPARRTEEDISIIFSKMKTLKVFEKYPEDILLELSRYTLYDTFLANVTLYRPGERGEYWYAVVSGSLEMLDVDPDDSTKTNSICYLRDGDSFGENVIYGTCRHTTIVTTEYCELLYLEAHNIRRIYDAHKDRMEMLLQVNSTTSVSPEPDDLVDTGDKNGVVTDSELVIAGITLHQLIIDHFKDLISDHKINLYTHRQCCSGAKLVDWIISQSTTPRTRIQVVQMWQALLTEGVLQHVFKEHSFRDDPHLFYQFIDIKVNPEPKPRHRWSSMIFHHHHQQRGGGGGGGGGGAGGGGKMGDLSETAVTNGRPRSTSSFSTSPRSSRSSISSILEECFDTIAHLGPETLIYATLKKEPAERTEVEIDLIYEEVLNMRALRHLSNVVKREISACARLDHYKKAGKYLYHQGDKGGAWYVILRGSVSLIIDGKGVICTLHEGDEFGKLGVVNETVRSSSVQVREDNCYFLVIERDDFRRILFSVKSTTIKVTEHGREVLVLEKGSLGQYLIVKGTPEKMLSHLLESEVEIGSQEDTFAQDFFLTYPAFMSISDLCDELRKTYKGKVSTVQQTTPTSSSSTTTATTPEEDQNKLRKRRVANAVCIWLKTANAELVKDVTFLKLLRELQDSLPKDGLTQQLTELTSSLATSIKSSNTTSSSSSPSPATAGIGIQSFLKNRSKSVNINSDHEIKMGVSAVPPHQPQDKAHFRVHTIDHTCCRLQIRLDTTARDIVKEACVKLSCEERSHDLCEVKSSGEVLKLNDKDVSVSSGMSVNGRLYIIPKKYSERTVSPLPDQNQKPVVQFRDKESSRDIAVHITVYDWNLFSNTQQMEYIYHMFGRHKFGKITTNLDVLLSRFNQVQYWVVTEVVREPDIVKRVSLIKKFIKIAAYLKSFNNMNSFLAVTIGLMNGAITRLRQTWSQVPLRAKTRLETFQALTDPSRNHSVLRALESKLAPPVIPFMPLVTKDAYFLHIGNETYVGDLVNFEKMRLVASSVRSLKRFRAASLPQDLRLTAHKNPDLQHYIRSLQVIDNEVHLIQMSHKVEPSSRPASTAT